MHYFFFFHYDIFIFPSFLLFFLIVFFHYDIIKSLIFIVFFYFSFLFCLFFPFSYIHYPQIVFTRIVLSYKSALLRS